MTTTNSSLNEQNLSKIKQVSRMEFIKLAWAGLGGLIATQLGVISLRYVQPQVVEGSFGGVIYVGPVGDFPPGSVTHFQEGRFYLSRLVDGGFLAIYQRCTHLGCTVPWDQAQEKFICPCHNSQFTEDGSVINPPAPRALDLFPITIEDGYIKVDTSKTIARDGFDPEQAVYQG